MEYPITVGGAQSLSGGIANYDYLPNGLRCTKLVDATYTTLEESHGLSGFYDNNTFVNDMTTRYRYDGQMTIEEDVTFMDGETQVVDQTSYLVGARGYEMIHAKRLSGPNAANYDKVSFPIYDGHGNMIATLGKTSSGFDIQNEKKYDVWGAVRSSTGAGSHVVNPNKQYCANLGHTWDGESGLIYKRARYYEPSTGRFISEDPARDGLNWYRYGNSNPVEHADFDGKRALLANLWMKFKNLISDVFEKSAARGLSGISLVLSVAEHFVPDHPAFKTVKRLIESTALALLMLTAVEKLGGSKDAKVAAAAAGFALIGAVVAGFALYQIVLLGILLFQGEEGYDRYARHNLFHKENK